MDRTAVLAEKDGHALVGSAPPCHLLDGAQIGANRAFSVIAAHEFFAHPLGEFGHRDLLFCGQRYRLKSLKSSKASKAGIWYKIGTKYF
jgi:hypothetical protein